MGEHGKPQYSLIGKEEGQKGDEPINTASSTWKSLFNLISYTESMGILALPYAIQRGGILAIASLVVVPFICYYTSKILVECMYIKDGSDKKVRIRNSYKDLTEAWFPRFGGIVAVAVQVVQLVLLTSSYLVLCGSLLHGTMPDAPIPLRAWMVIAGCVGLPTAFIKHLSQVAWFSLLSAIALFLALAIILGFGVIFHKWDINQISLVYWDTKGEAIALNIIVFSYDAHSVIPTVECDMKNPAQFNLVLAITYVNTLILKVIFALGFFLAFSPNINEVISNSISYRPVHIVVSSLFFINVLCSYPFLVRTIIHVIEDAIDSETFKFQEMRWFISVRILMCLAVLLPAITIPHFALIMSLSGSLVGMLAVFILPCAFHLFFQSDRLLWYQKGIDYFIIVLGVMLGAIGVVVSVIDIVKTF